MDKILASFFLLASLATLFMMNVTLGMPTHHMEHHGDMGHHVQLDNGHGDEHGDGNVSPYPGFKNMAALNVAGTFLGNADVMKAAFKSITDEETGPFLVVPMVQMLCAATREDATAAVECTTEEAVKAVQQAIGSMDIEKMAQNPFAVLDLLGEISQAISPKNKKPTSGHRGQPKLSDVVTIITDSISCPCCRARKLEEVEEKFVEGLKHVFATGKETMAASNEADQVPTGASLIQGAIRLFLADRDLQKALLQNVLDTPETLSSMAEYFSAKYGLLTQQQAEGAIRDTIQAMLDNWSQREVIFGLMKGAYLKLSGKTIPIDFNMYDALVQGIKDGDIDLPAILGYLGMSHVDPTVIKALEDYDAKVFGRIKYLYVPAFRFSVDFFQKELTKATEQ